MYLDLIKGCRVTIGRYNASLKEHRENTVPYHSSPGMPGPNYGRSYRNIQQRISTSFTRYQASLTSSVTSEVKTEHRVQQYQPWCQWWGRCDRAVVNEVNSRFQLHLEIMYNLEPNYCVQQLNNWLCLCSGLWTTQQFVQGSSNGKWPPHKSTFNDGICLSIIIWDMMHYCGAAWGILGGDTVITLDSFLFIATRSRHYMMGSFHCMIAMMKPWSLQQH